MEIEKVISRTVIDLNEEATVIITESFMDQMKYLCSEISEVEWSGLVFFATKGTPKNLSTFKLTPYYIHLMNKGTSTYTEFDSDDSLIPLYKEMPELDPFEDTKFIYGKIHSHVDMQSYHSATDMQDLQDQAGKYDYYFSLIVNNKMELDAKIAFVAEIPSQPIKPNRFTGNKDWRLGKEEVLGVIDMNFELEDSIISIPQHFKDRLKVVTTVKPIVASKHIPNYILDEYEEEISESYMSQIPASVNNVIADRQVELGEALVVKWIADKFKIDNHLNAVQARLIQLPTHVINNLEEPLYMWYTKLSPWEKNNIAAYITSFNLGSSLAEEYEDVIEMLWDFISAEEKEVQI